MINSILLWEQGPAGSSPSPPTAIYRRETFVFFWFCNILLNTPFQPVLVSPESVRFVSDFINAVNLYYMENRELELMLINIIWGIFGIILICVGIKTMYLFNSIKDVFLGLSLVCAPISLFRNLYFNIDKE